MTLPTILLIIVSVAAIGMAILWVIQRKTGDAGIVDAGWALFLAASAVFTAFVATGDLNRRIALAVMNGFWAARLGTYLLRDRVLSGAEDGRYCRMRAAMGKHAQMGFLIFFQVQAGFVVLFATPVVAAAGNTNPFGLLDVIGIAIGLIAIAGEITADRQLAAYRRRPGTSGKTCREGLWRYSRHPNYFFEWLHWFAYAFLAMGAPYQWLGFAGPVVMFIFLFKITGIPFTEQQASSHRPDYKDYQRTTSIFFPWPPKKSD